MDRDLLERPDQVAVLVAQGLVVLDRLSPQFDC